MYNVVGHLQDLLHRRMLTSRHVGPIHKTVANRRCGSGSSVMSLHIRLGCIGGCSVQSDRLNQIKNTDGTVTSHHPWGPWAFSSFPLNHQKKTSIPVRRSMESSYMVYSVIKHHSCMSHTWIRRLQLVISY